MFNYANYINYVNPTAKVFYDKTLDYFNYYRNNTNSNKPNESVNDTINNYSDIIKVDLYENENESSRIYPSTSLYNEYSVFWGEPTHVIDNIYLGSAFNAASYPLLKRLNIKVIMNATAEISNYYEHLDEFKYIKYELYDNNQNRIIKHLEKSYNDIRYHQHYTGGNILIHCFMGASRSASIVLHYLMKTYSYTFDEAVEYLRKKRIIVNPTFRLTKDLASSICQK